MARCNILRPKQIRNNDEETNIYLEFSTCSLKRMGIRLPTVVAAAARLLKTSIKYVSYSLDPIKSYRPHMDRWKGSVRIMLVMDSTKLDSNVALVVYGVNQSR